MSKNIDLANDKLVLGGDVSFNHSDNLVTSESNRANYLPRRRHRCASRLLTAACIITPSA